MATVWVVVHSCASGHDVNTEISAFANMDALERGLRTQLQALYEDTEVDPKYDLAVCDLDDLIDQAENVSWDLGGYELIVQETDLES